MNSYECHNCGQAISTVDLDEGVTPYMIPCVAWDRVPGAPKCKGPMKSDFYRPKPGRPAAQYEWYKPTPEQTAKLDPGMREHVEAGGLMLRHFSEHAASEARR